MATVAILQSVRPTHHFRTILTGGLIAGLLDGLDAAVFFGLMRGIPVIRVFQFIASGLIGSKAFHWGWAAAILGALCHLAIALGATAVFFSLSQKFPMILGKVFVWGAIDGIGVFLFMRYVMVPLSFTPRQPPAHAAAIVNLIFSHVFFVGFPIALVTRRAARSL